MTDDLIKQPPEPWPRRPLLLNKLISIPTFPFMAKAIATETNPLTRYYWPALFLLHHYFGHDFVDRWVSPSSYDEHYLRSAPKTDEEFETHQVRVIHLGELLVNLQYFPGFWDVLERMKTTGVEVGVSELESGALLKRLRIDFAFRSPSGHGGSDYDLDIQIDGLYLCGETKCKIESTAKSAKSVCASLETARAKNLPSDKPGVVFLKMPLEWLRDSTFMREVSASVAESLRQKGRIVAVVLATTGSVPLPHGNQGLSISKVLFNRESRFFDPRVTTLGRDPPLPMAWLELYPLWEPILRQAPPAT